MAKNRPVLQASARQHLGSRYALRLRREGKLPAVVYGHKTEPAHVTLDQEQFVEQLHHGAHLLDLQHDGQTETCLIKDVQYDYLGTNVIHVDLARVDLTETITVSVPLVLKGQDLSPGAKTPGAIVEHPIVDLEVLCRADNIPDQIIVDISGMNLDDAITVADLKLPEGVTTEHNEDDVVVSIHTATEEEEVAAPAAATGTEPEVLTERKKEEGSAAAKPEAKKGK